MEYVPLTDFTPGNYVMIETPFGGFTFGIIVDKKVEEVSIPTGAKTSSFIYLKQVSADYVGVYRKNECFIPDLELLIKCKNKCLELVEELNKIENDLIKKNEHENKDNL